MAVRGLRTQGLTEGAILAALVALFAIATRYLPLLGVATAWLCPLPLAVLVIRHGFRTAVLAAVAATFVGAMLAGPLVGLAILISFAPMGVVLGVGAQRGWPAVRTVVVAGVVSFISIILNFLGLMGGGRISVDEMARTMERSVAMAADLYTRLGFSPEQITQATTQMQQAARLMPYLLPWTLVFGALFAAWLNYEVGRRVLQRFGYRWPALPPLRTWRVPAVAVWLIPLSYLLLALSAQGGGATAPTPEPGGLDALSAVRSPLASAALGLFLATQSLFVFQGLVAGWVIIGNYGFGRLGQALLIFMVFAVPALSVAALVLGVLDSTLKVRERWGVPRTTMREAKP
ncbi:MAG: DUF2232 domain-containing protein [Armatimonadota bacterium]|nr:DUF2232 domain-containing protein [Armatimonadota bacterium]